MAGKITHNTIHWFRKGLRLHDNPSLKEAFESSVSIRPIYVLDSDDVQHGNIGVVRWRFLLQSLEDLDRSLRKLNSRLFVVRGKSTVVLPKLFKEWNIDKLTFEVDTDGPARQRDSEMVKLANDAGVNVIQKVSHTLYNLDDVLGKNLGRAPSTYKSFQAVISSLGPPEAPLPTIEKTDVGECKTPVDDDHDTLYGLPTLEEIGLEVPYESKDVLYPGGETEALRRMHEYMAKEDWVCKFEKPNTSPNSLEPSTTVLSPYLAIGCLSARLFYVQLTDIYSRAKKHSQPPVSLYGQLLWREFFSTCAYNIPNFNKMEGNSVCLQIPWDKNDEYLKAWAEVSIGGMC